MLYKNSILTYLGDTMKFYQYSMSLIEVATGRKQENVVVSDDADLVVMVNEFLGQDEDEGLDSHIVQVADLIIDNTEFHKVTNIYDVERLLQFLEANYKNDYDIDMVFGYLANQNFSVESLDSLPDAYIGNFTEQEFVENVLGDELDNVPDIIKNNVNWSDVKYELVSGGGYYEIDNNYFNDI